MDDWFYTLRVNLNSVQYLTRGLYSLMQATGRSRVTTISNLGSVQPKAS
jgi:NAD(P)-dependent dehydrogenase (short-subunit alcohol dehydrogenase family)